jgi:taurine dioxygenase
MPADLRGRIEGKRAVHSAKNAYAPTGMYGKGDTGRSMDIRPSDDAQATQTHPIIKAHPETGRQSLFGCAGYIVGIEGMDQQEGWDLITEIYRWQTRPEFQYRHKWTKDMLVMWDNRCTLHMATGGYAGHDRLLHRTTIGAA